MVAVLRKLIEKVWHDSPREELIPWIRETADDFAELPDSCLAEQTAQLRSRLDGEFVDDAELLIPATALVAESIRREMGFPLHNVQLLGAIVIAGGQIAEMQTGEGKTLVAIAGAFIGSLTGRGVHVATTNDYLATRDYETAAPILKRLGLSTGLLQSNASVAATRAAYHCDVTYGSGYQFGFDYLRDQLALAERSRRPLGHRVATAIHGMETGNGVLRQRGFAMAIIDEADSVMIDEAMVPLIISGAAGGEESDEAYLLANKLIGGLTAEEDFTIDARRLTLAMTKSGKTKVHAALLNRAVPDLIRPWSRYIENALQAHHRFQRDQHYVVVDGEVQIVDQNTGRIFADRTWRDGLHQAVEAKERVEIRPSEQSTSRITRQRFFRFYEATCADRHNDHPAKSRAVAIAGPEFDSTPGSQWNSGRRGSADYRPSRCRRIGACRHQHGRPWYRHQTVRASAPLRWAACHRYRTRAVDSNRPPIDWSCRTAGQPRFVPVFRIGRR